jgi:hypothetical protein
VSDVWWRALPGGEIAELLTVAPGPVTTPENRWVGSLVLHAEGWTIVNVTPLGPLRDEARSQEECRLAAIELVAARLHERVVAADPFASGIVLARRTESTLTLAPALVSDRGEPVISLEPASVLDGARPDEVDVDLAAGVPARLPAAVLARREPCDLLLPALHLPPPAPGGELVVRL